MRLIPLLACLALAACDLGPSAAERNAAAAKESARHKVTETIEAPIERAKAANDPNVQSDADKEKAIRDAGG